MINNIQIVCIKKNVKNYLTITCIRFKLFYSIKIRNRSNVNLGLLGNYFQRRDKLKLKDHLGNFDDLNDPLICNNGYANALIK